MIFNHCYYSISSPKLNKKVHMCLKMKTMWDTKNTKKVTVYWLLYKELKPKYFIVDIIRLSMQTNASCKMNASHKNHSFCI